MRFSSFRLLLTCCLLFGWSTVEAQTGQLRGHLLNDQNGLPASNVQVSIPFLKVLTYSSGQGDFELSQIPYGSHTIIIGGGNFRADTFRVLIDKDIVYLADRKLTPNESNTSMSSIQIPSVALEDNNESTDDDGARSSGASGLLSAANDPFTNTAAFVFGPYRFMPRSYERNAQKVLVNGLEMNDIETGDAYWSQWGGLNDVFRNRATTYGLIPSEYTFGSILGSVYFDVSAANQRKQTRLTYSSSNRQYRHRIMATHSTGLMKNGWAFSVSASRRYADEGYVEGTFYDGYSYYASASKKLGKGMLSLTTFGAPTKRGKMAPSTQEANDLAGSNYYNPNWGLMNGEKKNAKVYNGYQPVTMLNYTYSPNNKTNWNTALGYQFGKVKNSSLDWYEGNNPRPDYYKNLPSYYQTGNNINPDLAVIQGNYFSNNAQIDWDNLVQQNYMNTVNRIDANGNYTGETGKQSIYVISNDVDDIQKWTFNTNLDKSISDHISVQTGINYIYQKTESYRQLDDLLGGEFYINKNQFIDRNTIGSGLSIDNDANNPNQEIRVGDKYNYNYINTFNKGWVWAQGNFKFNKFDFFAGGTFGFNNFSREGLFRNGLFQEGNLSYGKGDKMNFLIMGAKGGFTFKIDGRNFIFGNAQLQTDAPTVDNTYISPRTRNEVVSKPKTQQTVSYEGGFLHRSPKMNIRAVGYITNISNATEIKRFYNESDGANTFTNYAIQGLNSRYQGIEFATEYKVSSALSIKGVLAHGQAYYLNNPFVDIYLDNKASLAAIGGYAGSEQVYIKNYRIATGPQTAATLGLNYRSKKYWYASLNINYFDNNYVDIAPNKRTIGATELMDRESEQFKSMVHQEKFKGGYTVDLFAGKSFLLSKSMKNLPRNTYLYFNAGINNILNNKELKTGGFEQLRYDADGRTSGLFPSKYFYAMGINYFINVSLKF